MRGSTAMSFGTAVALLFSTVDVSGADKSTYSLFNPTPDRLLRDMETDRPDISESAFTVDAGRVQIESTLFGYTRSRPDQEGAVTDSYEFATTNVRVGLTNSAEIDFVLQPYGIARTRQVDPATIMRQSGIGRATLRAKFNLWGNDTFEKPGATALALLPFVVLPTDRHNGISPEFISSGLIVPFAMKLSDKWSVALNGAINYTRKDSPTGYHPEYVATASFSYEWSERLGTYYEVAGRFHTEDPRGDTVVLGTGITYKLSKNVQLDGGVNFGVTPASDRLNPFVGLSTRF